VCFLSLLIRSMAIRYNTLGTLLEIMLADEHLRTSIAHITLVLGSYLIQHKDTVGVHSEFTRELL
jgi:hypothetical protein